MRSTPVETNALKTLSLEHRQVLQVCENIRIGLRKSVEKVRIRRYIDWFKKEYLDLHFDLEEQHIFPLLGSNVRVKKALANHRRIKKLLSCDCDNERVLNLLEEELSTYIRFEERVLYKEIAFHATPEDLAHIEKLHDNISFSEDEWQDKFWLS